MKTTRTSPSKEVRWQPEKKYVRKRRVHFLPKQWKFTEKKEYMWNKRPGKHLTSKLELQLSPSKYKDFLKTI